MEEPILYGLWDDERWFVSREGALFYTEYLRIARMVLGAYQWKPNPWTIRIIGPDGLPVVEIDLETETTNAQFPAAES